MANVDVVKKRGRDGTVQDMVTLNGEKGMKVQYDELEHKEEVGGGGGNKWKEEEEEVEKEESWVPGYKIQLQSGRTRIGCMGSFAVISEPDLHVHK